jgi:hypothetical protein
LDLFYVERAHICYQCVKCVKLDDDDDDDERTISSKYMLNKT